MPESVRKLSLVVWMNQPSHYQTAFFRELAARRGVTLHVVYAVGVPQNRKALGWREPEPEVFSQRVLSGWREGVTTAWNNRQAVHLVNGVWSVRIFVLCSGLLLLIGGRVFFHSERPNPGKTRRQILHWLKAIWVRLLFLRSKGIFVIGRQAGHHYRQLGVPEEKIFPFMYFNHGGRAPTEKLKDRPFTVIYVGQFVPRKRVEDLIEAFALFCPDSPRARLRLVGAGVLKKNYKLLVHSAELKGLVEIVGPLEPAKVIKEIQAADVLVLPSAFDGWGLTVNEALQSGVPAICSDACGAAELLEENSHWGLVYSAGSIDGLADALHSVAQRPEYYRPDVAEIEAQIGVAAQSTRFLQVVMTQRIEIEEDVANVV